MEEYFNRLTRLLNLGEDLLILTVGDDWKMVDILYRLLPHKEERYFTPDSKTWTYWNRFVQSKVTVSESIMDAHDKELFEDLCFKYNLNSRETLDTIIQYANYRNLKGYGYLLYWT